MYFQTMEEWKLILGFIIWWEMIFNTNTNSYKTIHIFINNIFA